MSISKAGPKVDVYNLSINSLGMKAKRQVKQAVPIIKGQGNSEDAKFFRLHPDKKVTIIRHSKPVYGEYGKSYKPTNQIEVKVGNRGFKEMLSPKTFDVLAKSNSDTDIIQAAKEAISSMRDAYAHIEKRKRAINIKHIRAEKIKAAAKNAPADPKVVQAYEKLGNMVIKAFRLKV